MPIIHLPRILLECCRSSQKIVAAARLTAVLVLLFPYIVGFAPSPSDSSGLAVTVAGGVGSYAHVSRDCSGKVIGVTDVPYDDGAVGVEKKFRGGAAGVRAGGFHTAAEAASYPSFAPQSSWYVNPYVAVEGRVAGLQVGLAFFHNAPRGGDRFDRLKYNQPVLPTFRFRYGGRDNFHFLSSFASNMPLGTGGGIIDIGLGFPVWGSGGSGWVGFGFTPYEEGCVSFKTDIPVLENLSLNPRLQLRMGDATEYGLSLGATMAF